VKGRDVSVQRKATIAKRQREMDQKDRTKERETRRNDRRLRIQERAALGRTGPEIVPPVAPPVAVAPGFEEDGPRSVAELRATRLGFDLSDEDIAEERRYRNPDEAAEAE
jgi:hypothetical protein